MKSLQQRFPTSSDEYSPEEVYRIEPIGSSWKIFSRKVTSSIEDVEKNPVSRVNFLIGRYGMGKTLFVRKKITEVFRDKPFTLPLYMPLRRLFYALQRARKRFDSFLKFYLKWYVETGFSLVDVKSAWETGKTTSGLFKSRYAVLKELADKSITSVDELLRIIRETGFIPIFAMDELEALITRETRDLLGSANIVGTSTAHDVVADLFVEMYDISSGTAPWNGLLILASVYDLEEWPTFIVREIVNYGVGEKTLAEFAERLRLPRGSIERIAQPSGLNERREIAKEELAKIKPMFPLLQQATYQRLKERVVKIRYRSSDYREFLQRLGLKVPKERELLLDLFYQISLTPRTLISLAKSMREQGLSIVNYDSLSKIMVNSGKVDELRNILFDIVKIRHAKWHKRLASLVEQGLIIFETDIVLEDVGAREDLLNRLSKALFVKIKRPVTFDDVRRVNDILTSLRLKYKFIKHTYVKGSGVYYLDENLLRWLLGDEYDVFGEKIDIEEYIRTYFVPHRT